MQSVSSRVWTRVAVSISYDDNHYTTATFGFADSRVTVSDWSENILYDPLSFFLLSFVSKVDEISACLWVMAVEVNTSGWVIKRSSDRLQHLLQIEYVSRKNIPKSTRKLDKKGLIKIHGFARYILWIKEIKMLR